MPARRSEVRSVGSQWHAMVGVCSDAAERIAVKLRAPARRAQV